MSKLSSCIQPSWRKPLALAIAALFAVSANNAGFAAVLPVTNCDDATPASAGSLRQVIAVAQSGDVVDLSGLPTLGCSTITIRAGEIVVPQDSLTLNGSAGNSPGEQRVTLDGKYSVDLDRGRVLHHTGYGQLTVEGLVVRGGSVYSTSNGEYGGCVLSKGSVLAFRTTLEYCQANAKGHAAAGGAVFANGNVFLEYATVKNNNAGAQAASSAYGGGIHAGNYLYVGDSMISQNVAGGGVGVGGGIHALKGANVVRSTISGNRASSNGGGMYVKQITAGSKMTLADSTISGNVATNGFAGGVYTNEDVTAYNITLAFNTAEIGKRSADHYDAPGLDIVPSIASVNAILRNSIFANNRYGSIDSDISIYDVPGKVVSVTGSGNLIVEATFLTPAGLAVSSSCPLLGPLRDNGGVTFTHALSSGSPAIDSGDNTYATATYDQRYAPNIRKDHGTVDIGAYEVQQEDIIFTAGLDGC